jgi:hypothetical protein
MNPTLLLNYFGTTAHAAAAEPQVVPQLTQRVDDASGGPNLTPQADQHGDPASPRRPPTTSDALDPELVALPAPPRHEKVLVVGALALVATLACAFAFTLRTDVRYVFETNSRVELGELGIASTNRWSSNRFVHATASLGAADALRYERPFADGSFRLAPVLGRSDIWVELRIPPRSESVRFVPPSEFTGRLVRFADAGARHRGLATAVATLSDGLTAATVAKQAPAEDRWLLVADEAPADARWSVLVVALCLGFAGFCAFIMRKITRRIPTVMRDDAIA